MSIKVCPEHGPYIADYSTDFGETWCPDCGPQPKPKPPIAAATGGERFTDERIDPVCTRIQETGTAVDLPEVLKIAAERLGITDYTLEFQGVMLYRLRVAAAAGGEG